MSQRALAASAKLENPTSTNLKHLSLRVFTVPPDAHSGRSPKKHPIMQIFEWKSLPSDPTRTIAATSQQVPSRTMLARSGGGGRENLVV